MVILDVSKELGTLSTLGLIGCIALAVIDPIYFVEVLIKNIGSFLRWFWFIVLVIATGLCVYAIPTNMVDVYKLYPNDVTIEEISGEYEIISVDGLLVTAYKKDEK